MKLPESVYVHPTALVETDKIGENTRIWAFTTIRKAAHLGEACNICDYTGVEAYVGNRVTIKEFSAVALGVHVEDDVFIGPRVLTMNDAKPRSPRMQTSDIADRYEKEENWLVETRICKGATIGGGVIIAPGVTIGAYAMVGTGSLVVKDVPPHRLVVGHPARGIGWVCICNKKLDESDDGYLSCPDCSRRYQKVDKAIQLVEEHVQAK